MISTSNASAAKRHASTCLTTPGDTVLVRQPRRHKMQSQLYHRPYTVTRKRGTTLTAKRNEHEMPHSCSNISNSNRELWSSTDTEVYIPTTHTHIPPSTANERDDGDYTETTPQLHSPFCRDTRHQCASCRDDVRQHR